MVGTGMNKNGCIYLFMICSVYLAYAKGNFLPACMLRPQKSNEIFYDFQMIAIHKFQWFSLMICFQLQKEQIQCKLISKTFLGATGHQSCDEKTGNPDGNCVLTDHGKIG
jgi:hypothetical protein